MQKANKKKSIKLTPLLIQVQLVYAHSKEKYEAAIPGRPISDYVGRSAFEAYCRY